ncbi:MAG: transcriptional regulator [Thermoplasmata archaeon]
MELPREQTIERIRAILESAGFYVSDAHSIRPTSFDLLARRDSLLLIVKVLKNIDALDPEEARRLRELSALFPAAPILVGQTSGALELEAGVVYNRYGIPIVVEESLSDLLLKGLPPFLFSSPGGIFARIDGARLRVLREARQLSLGALASVAGVSRRTIQLYEEGAGAEVSVVERIETYLGEPVAMPIDLLPRRSATPENAGGTPPTARSTPKGSRAGEPSGAGVRPMARTGDRMRDVVFHELGGMGWEVTVTIRCPFDAFTRSRAREDEEILLTTVGSLRSAQHRADVLQGLARVAEGHALFILREEGARRSIDGLPVMTLRELQRLQGRDELLETISERENA